MTKTYKKYSSLILLLATVFSVQAQNLVSVINYNDDDYSETRYSNDSFQDNEKVNYNLWEGLLQKHVSSNGSVNYEGFKSDSRKFNDFLRDLSKVRISSSWTKSDKMAFWINAYNAYTVKLIVDNYPVASIKNISGAWKKKFFSLNGKLMSLGEVEHQVLRGFGDSRIHFAINCASASCPRLIQVPFKASNLERLLERQTKEFINDPFYNTITEYSANVSKLFDWYKKDFKNDAGTVVNFINKYSDISIKNQNDKGYKKYDWTLNSKK